jgi:hypothetical protein
MLSHAFLASRPALVKSAPQPAKVARDGWYPSTWVVRWDGQRNEYLVALDGLTWRDAMLPRLTTTADAAAPGRRRVQR